MRPAFLLILPLIISASTIASGVGEPKFGTFKVDVVSLLTDGKTEQGKPELAAERQGYRYLFTTQIHLNEFKNNPTKFEVQLGGACGKMAELAGRGSTDRYWIHKNKLYIFASDGCRTGFQSNPEGHIEVDEPRLKATPFEARKGRELLDKAAKWTGLDKIRKSGSVTYLQESELKQGNTTYAVKGTTQVASNGDYYDVTTYNGAGYANQISKGKAVEIDSKGAVDEHVPTWKRALERQRARSLAYLLLNRSSKNLTAKFDGVANGIASVVVNLDGATSTLWIDEATGKVISQTVKGRNRPGIIGDVQLEFTSYAKSNGITLPVAWTGTYNGQDSPLHERKVMRLEVKKG